MLFLMFSAILLYRICRCCRRIYVKLLHTVFHALAIPCVALGFLAVLDSHNLADPPIPNFYSLHSWIGLVTMGLFAIQVNSALLLNNSKFMIEFIYWTYTYSDRTKWMSEDMNEIVLISFLRNKHLWEPW